MAAHCIKIGDIFQFKIIKLGKQSVCDFNLMICSLSIMKRDIFFPIFDRKGML